MRQSLGRFLAQSSAECSQHTPRLLGHCLHFMACLSFTLWLCDRRCWPGGQETSPSGGFGNSLIEVPGVTHGVALKGWEFSEEKYITCVLQTSRLACTFLILVEE